jgi:transcriptional regulator with XRE-family HTH domain
MPVAASLIKEARSQAGLTQAQLGRRLGISQAAVARMESPEANPTIATLASTLRGAGQQLVLNVEPLKRGIDETLVFEQLRLTPEQRLAQLERTYEWGRELSLAGARARGELA